MKKNLFALAIGIFSILFATSCESDKPETGGGGTPTPTNEVSAWIYKQLQENYLWSIPTNIDNKPGPEEYFAQIKNSADYVSDLWKTADRPTTASYDIGFEYAINHYQTDNKIYYIIYYVKPNTSAATADLKRGYLITKVNGDEPKSVDEAKTLMSEAIKTGNPITLTVMVPGGDRTLPFVVTPQVINENPVYFSQTSTVNGNKVGYVLYNKFGANDNNEKYNKEIINKLQEFYNDNISYLILDLRYNDWGRISTAQIIASALVKGASTSDAFIIHKRREDLNKDTEVKFVDTAEGLSIPKLGDKLTKLYIITGKSTGATSESFTNALKAYWGSNLVVVGDQTLGKSNIASDITQNSNKEWSMLVALSYMADKNGNYNYQSGITPNEAISEVNESNVSKILGDFGTENEAVYAKVISLISGLRSTSETYYNNNEVISSIQDKPFAGITFAN